MRRLTKKQEKIIEKYISRYYRDFENNGNVEILLEELEKINDYETLWSDADRYAWDYYNKCIFYTSI